MGYLFRVYEKLIVNLSLTSGIRISLILIRSIHLAYNPYLFLSESSYHYLYCLNSFFYERILMCQSFSHYILDFSSIFSLSILNQCSIPLPISYLLFHLSRMLFFWEIILGHLYPSTLEKSQIVVDLYFCHFFLASINLVTHWTFSISIL